MLSRTHFVDSASTRGCLVCASRLFVCLLNVHRCCCSPVICQTATPFLIGTKYDYFSTLKMEEKKEMTLQARRFAKAMKAPLLFCSASHAINIHKIFKVVLAKVFDLKCTVPQITEVGDPIIEYEQSATATEGEGHAEGGDQDTDAVVVPSAPSASSTSADDADTETAGHRKNKSSTASIGSSVE